MRKSVRLTNTGSFEPTRAGPGCQPKYQIHQPREFSASVRWLLPATMASSLRPAITTTLDAGLNVLQADHHPLHAAPDRRHDPELARDLQGVVIGREGAEQLPAEGPFINPLDRERGAGRGEPLHRAEHGSRHPV